MIQKLTIPKVSSLWENYNNMPNKTTILDRIIENEMAERHSHIEKSINEATSRDYINSKKIDAKPLIPQVDLLTWVKEATGKGKKLDINL